MKRPNYRKKMAWDKRLKNWSGVSKKYRMKWISLWMNSKSWKTLTSNFKKDTIKYRPNCHLSSWKNNRNKINSNKKYKKSRIIIKSKSKMKSWLTKGYINKNFNSLKKISKKKIMSLALWNKNSKKYLNKYKKNLS